MGWLSQKLTAKIDRPVAAAVLFVGVVGNVGKRAKKGAAVASPARSLATYHPRFYLAI